MKKAIYSGDVLDTLSLTELCRFCGVETRWIVELVDHGAIEPQGVSIEEWQFRGPNIAKAKKARRLNRDLGINAAGVAMVLDLIDERDRLMRRLARYETL
jgi:chaperone modulatory protein CbpM